MSYIQCSRCCNQPRQFLAAMSRCMYIILERKSRPLAICKKNRGEITRNNPHTETYITCKAVEMFFCDERATFSTRPAYRIIIIDALSLG